MIVDIDFIDDFQPLDHLPEGAIGDVERRDPGVTDEKQGAF
jgi:hypothetical protein